jgi:SAM-dependent methyltransferase
MGVDSIVEGSDVGARTVREGDALRARLHGMWAGVADGWKEHADYVDARSAEVTQRMLAWTRPIPGERVLELACGPGSAGLAAAELVGPGGEVVVSDVAAEMTAIAAARAEALGLSNVTGRVLDIERIEQPGDAYDVVLCREGLMFVPDPARGTREIARVLRPGGRAALAVWGPRESNPWLGVVFDAVAAELGRPVPPPGMPGPFSLGDADALADLLGTAGLVDVTVAELAVPLRAGSFEEWWTRTCALAGPLTSILAALPEDARQALRHRAREAVRPFQDHDGLELPGLTLLAFGRRP